MKKLLWILLALLMLAPPALAEDTELELPGSASVWVKDAFYWLNRRGDGQVDVLRQKPGEDTHAVVCTVPGVPEDVNPQDYTQAMKEAVEQAIDRLFDLDGALYAINYRTGRAGAVGAQGVAWTDARLDTADYFYQGNLSAYRQGFAQEGIYYAPVDAMDADIAFNMLHLLATDLATGQTVTIRPDNALGFAPYRPGQLLALCLNRAAGGAYRWQLAEMDAKTGAMTPLPMEMPEARAEQPDGVGAIGYDMAADAYFYATPQKLMMSRGKQPFALTALLPFDYMMPDSVSGFALPDGRYALTQWGRAVVRTVGQVIDVAQSLTVQTGWGGVDTPDAFKREHPDAVVFKMSAVTDAGQVGALIQGGDTENDIFVLPVNPALRALIDKGYAKPLALEALTRDFATLYPAVQDALRNRDGQPCAWPLSFHWGTGHILESAWNKYFGDEPYPTTYGELFDAMARFARMEEGEDPEAYFLFGMDYDRMVDMVVDAYIRQYEQPGQALAFDRAALKEALDKLAQANAIMAAGGAKPQEFEGETTGDPRNAPSLVHPFSGGGLFRIPHSFGETLREIPPFTFEKGETPVQPAQMFVLMINPRSRNAELAEQFLSGWLRVDTAPHTYYAVHPQANEPYLNPDFERRLQQTRDDLALYGKKLKEARDRNAPIEEIAAYEFRVQLAQQDLNEQDRLKYLIPRQGIENFRARARWLRLDDRLLLMSLGAQEQLDELRARYVAGELSLDGYLDAMTQMARLVYLESR